jgi:hypothetical protein
LLPGAPSVAVTWAMTPHGATGCAKTAGR